MATYIKGADTYLPDIKPFTPDYKFLSAVLQTRRDKYDSNFKATNDLYNKVVYADLSREDTKEKRDQYAEKIGPHIEKISGMDLSIQKNVDAAKSVFAPFIEDDLAVKDIVYTANYRDQMTFAQNIKDHPNEEVRNQWWKDGELGLQYRMDDFINASPEAAINMQVPKYVVQPNLAKLAADILDESGLSMEQNTFQVDSNGKIISDFIIKEKNGRLVTGAALEMIRSRLLSDPQIIRGYQESSFVSSRNFAQQGIQAGQFNGVEQGQQAWADETIRRITTANEIELDIDRQEYYRLNQANVAWDNYKALNGIVPGSDIENAMLENMTVAEATQAALDFKMGIKREAEAPVGSLTGSLNKAYNLIMNHNIMRDMKTAAQLYGSKDQEYLFEVNALALSEQNHQYKLAEIKAQDENDLFRDAENDRRAYDLAVAKGEIVGDDQRVLGNLFKQNNVNYGAAGTWDIPEKVNDEGIVSGEVDENVQMRQRTSVQAYENSIKVMNNQVRDIANILSIMNPEGDSEAKDQTYRIPIGLGDDGVMKEKRGTIQQLTEYLLEQEIIGDKIKYTNKQLISDIWQKYTKVFSETEEVMKSRPNLLNGPARTQYDDTYNQIFGPNGTDIQTTAHDVALEQVYDNYQETYLNMSRIESVKTDENVKAAFDAGFPDLINENGILRSSEDYIKTVISGVRNRSIRNFNSTDWFGESGDEFYISDRQVPTGRYYDVKTSGGGYESKQEMKSEKYLNEKEIREEALMVYTALNADLNKYLSGIKGDAPSGDFNSMLAGKGDDFGDAVNNPEYEATIDPTINTPVGDAEMSHLLMQIKDLDSKGIPYGIIVGKLQDYDGDPNKIYQKNDLAEKVFNAYSEQMSSWLNNSKSVNANSGKSAPKAKLFYRPVDGFTGDPSKETETYYLEFGGAWLASLPKGSKDQQYGVISQSDVITLGGTFDKDGVMTSFPGITFVFEQDNSINPKAKKNVYSSKVETAIIQNGNGFAEYVVPDGLVPTAKYRIIKISNGVYNLYAETNTYVPYNPKTKTGGKYLMEKNTKKINDISDGLMLGLRGLDQTQVQFEAYANLLRNQNRTAQLLDEKTYGIK
tara:strand:+ start:15025 stop:18297 length:3273 start_codon:yes stop_codon:yes gene_type:complete